MNDVTMRADCTRCAALCCVALALTPAQGFAIDKPAGKACPKLNEKNKCSIYDERQTHGFQGCMNYDCLGAGQLISEEVFKGRSWREEPDIVPNIMKVFRIMKKIQELKLLLSEASKLPLNATERDKLDVFWSRLHPKESWSFKTIELVAASDIELEVKNYLRSLSQYLDAGRYRAKEEYQ